MNNVVFLVSGGGANLKFIQKAISLLNLDCRISGVIADRDISFQEFLEEQGIELVKIKYNRENTSELKIALMKFNPDLIITNFHKVIDNDTLFTFKGKFINLHYSLLPAFSGLIGMKTIEEAKIQNVQFVGGTCHDVVEKVDAGKVICQGVFRVEDWNTECFEIVVDTVFKLSCFLLLTGICEKFQIKRGSIQEIEINKKKVYFSPPIPLDNIDFSLNIFNQLK